MSSSSSSVTKIKPAASGLDPEFALKRVQEIHHDKRFGWDKFVYTNARAKVEVICPTHGSFHIAYDSLKNGRGCRLCGYLTARKSNAYTTQEFIDLVKDKILDVNGNPMDYSSVTYTDRNTKVPVKCSVHGEFLLHPGNAINLGSGCPSCGTEKAHAHLRKSLELVQAEIAEVLDPTQYWVSDASDYTGNKSYIHMCCKDHGTWLTKSNWVLSGNKLGCPECSDSGTSQKEKELIDFIKSIYSGKVEVGTRKVITPLELDIYLPEINLAVEFNGLYWHSEAEGKGYEYHLNKTTLCKRKGIRLIHIYEDEWDLQQDIVKSKLKHILGVNKDKRCFARKLFLDRVSYKESSAFFETYHLQGAMANQKICYGLFDDGELVAAMSFGEPRFASGKEGEIELYRYAVKGQVVGGFSRLLKAFIRDHSDVKEILSFSDKRWSVGEVYESQGFRFEESTKPSYDYTSSNGKRYSRQYFMKSKLSELVTKGLLRTFDPNLTEVENMKNNGYYRIWNCGMDKWKLQVK